MPRNVETKARIDSVDALATVVAVIADSGSKEIIQDDTFFHCDGGCLKLRMFPSDSGELIFYRRSDEQGPKESFYVRSPTAEPETLRETLSLAYGQAGRVCKRRTLFLVGRTRVHLDRVEGLGDFMELEGVLEDGETTQEGIREAHELMDRLGIGADRLVQGSYVDLLNALSG
ncbi:MAG: class IV adenylate cyclase [Acidihalobacter sp.]|uniref:class IV adenylate cyclase n=1 Tax=Acidihalobacter sp. TaxID=1872108 RepID=UPI00307EAF77